MFALEFLNPILDPIFSPLLRLPPLLMIAIIALMITLIVTLIYKFTTKQDLMKTLKSEMKELQKEMKELKSQPEKAMAVNRKFMETQMKYMVQSFKSMIFTFIPIIIIFGYFNAHILYEPIMPSNEFTTTINFQQEIYGNVTIETPEEIVVIGEESREIIDQQATWVLKAEKEGNFNLFYRTNQRTYSKSILITTRREYKPPVENINDGIVRNIKIHHEDTIIVDLPFRILGYGGGWLGTYIIFSIIFSMIIRKFLKVY